MRVADAIGRRALPVALLVLACAVAQADEPQEWLAGMNQALTTRNYDGVFMHMRAGRIETMRIVHRVRGGVVNERLVSLDGSGREFIRSGDALTCYLPDKRIVLVEQRTDDGALLGSLPRFDASTAEFYDLRMVGRARLMGRDTRVIAVTPRDEYRYGYRLWIDEATRMPLKTQLCDGAGQVIEQIQFANLALASEISDHEFEPQVATEGFRWVRRSETPPRMGDEAVPAWHARRLPPGFRMTLRSAQHMPGAEGVVDHLVFSDGLASVSVFVEGARPDVQGVEGPASLGSASTFSTTVDGHRVTAVGEVPPRTVRFIADSVRVGGAALAAPPNR